MREPRPRRDAVVRHRFDQLFSLYTDVKENMNEWNLLQFAAIVEGMEDMTAAMDNFALRCKKMPGADSELSLNFNVTWSRRWRLHETAPP